MNQVRTNRLGTESIGRLLLGLAVPAITAQIVNILYNIVDRIYIGHIPGIGVSALTGVGVTFPVIMIISAFSSLVGMGGAPQAAIRMGEGRDDEAERILGNCFVVLVAISVLLTAVFLASGEQLLLMLGASTKTLPYALKYMNIYVCGTIFVQMALGLNNFITTQGFAKTSMLTVIIGAVINIILDPIFIFGLGMGVSGAAFATVISQAVSAFWVMKFLLGKRTRLRVLKKYMRLEKSVIIPVLLLGFSPFIMQSTESLLNFSFNSSLQAYGGDMAVGAMTILSSLLQMIYLPLAGLTQGAQPIIGYNFGAGNKERVKRTVKLLLISSLGFSFTLWALMRIFPHSFVAVFSSDPELVEFTVESLGVYMAVIFTAGAQMACQRTFVALGQAKASLFLALLRKIVLLIPLIYILPNFFDDKTFAVFLAEPVADFIATTVTVTIFSIQFKRILAGNTNTLT